MFTILLTIVVGFFMGHIISILVQKRQYKVHGPDSNKVKRQIHFDSKSGKYYRFEPYVTFCPVL